MNTELSEVQVKVINSIIEEAENISVVTAIEKSTNNIVPILALIKEGIFIPVAKIFTPQQDLVFDEFEFLDFDLTDVDSVDGINFSYEDSEFEEVPLTKKGWWDKIRLWWVK